MPKGYTLSKKQKLFCKLYLRYMNGTKAAIEAGYSSNSAAEIACENLTKPNIIAEINRLQGNLLETLDLSAAKIAKEYMSIGFIDKEKTENNELDTATRLKALELLSKMAGVAGSEKREITGANGAPIKTDSTHEVIFRDMTGKSISPDEV